MWVLMALLLLNCGVDTSSIFAGSSLKHSSNNAQESIIEIVLEQLLGFENAIPETESEDMEQQSHVKKAQLIDIFIVPDFALNNGTLANEVKKTELAEIQQHLSKFYFKIPSPPPEI
jgi:hypothetical protein